MQAQPTNLRRSRPRKVIPFVDSVETYFIQPAVGGPVKIGYTRRGGAPARLVALQVGNAYLLVVRHLLRGQREAEMHERFRELHIGGEWFWPGPDLCRYGHCKPDHEVDLLMVSDAYDEGFKKGFRRGWRKAGEVVSEETETIAMETAREVGRAVRRELVEIPEPTAPLAAELALERSQNSRRGAP